MSKWRLFLIGGWIAVTTGLFLAAVAGKISTLQFSVVDNGRKIIQATVMSLIVIPIIINLYKRLYQQFNKPEKKAYALYRLPHFLTGFIFVTTMAIISLFILDMFDWITLSQWYKPSLWVNALLLNMLIAFFFEALPEELAFRGFIYDVLRYRLSVWKSVLIQALIFISFSFASLILSILIGITPIASLASLPFQLILHFFFAIALILIRIWTGSLWASIGFHLGYLAIARFLLSPNEYGTSSIVAYYDNVTQGGGGIGAVMFIIFGSICLPLIILGIKKVRKRQLAYKLNYH